MRRLARVLITGGAGFLGTHLCGRLLDGGVEVVCVDDRSTSWPPNVSALRSRSRFSLVELDITAADPSDARLRGPFDVVFHLASPASPVDYLRLPVQTLRAGAHGTSVALELADRNAARFVLASTSEVYGDPLVHPQPESYWGNVNPIGPRSVYDEAKRFAEALAFAHHRAHGADIAVARIFNSYGPGMRADDGRMVPTFCRQALANEPITVAGNGLQTRSLCYVDDTVTGLMALAAGNLTGPVNLGSPAELTVLGVAQLIREYAGSASAIEHVAAVPDDPRRRRPDIRLARQTLGWTPHISAEVGLAQTVRWFRSQSAPRATA